MRYSTVNPQHNTIRNIFRQIRTTIGGLNRISTSDFFLLMGVGWLSEEKLTALNFTNGGPFETDLNQWKGNSVKKIFLIDIYQDAQDIPIIPPLSVNNDDYHTLHNLMFTEKRFQAFFWFKVVEFARNNNINISMIGGRSGGMDIASFMGLRTASWDQVDPQDHHYMRLHLASAFNSIIPLDAMNNGLYDAMLELWLRGSHVVPVLKKPEAQPPINDPVMNRTKKEGTDNAPNKGGNQSVGTVSNMSEESNNPRNTIAPYNIREYYTDALFYDL